jgi:succinate dehydrogenase / fumarate reductase membrane anchor subunit
MSESSVPRPSVKRAPLKTARGMGAAKAGMSEWIWQRVTAVALVFLCLWFLCFVIGLMGADHATAIATVAKPWNVVLLIAFLLAAIWHGQIGVQVILEDYVHGLLTAAVLQLALRLLCALVALAGIFAVLLIGLGHV